MSRGRGLVTQSMKSIDTKIQCKNERNAGEKRKKNTDTNHNRLFSTPSNLLLSSHDERGAPIDTLRKY